MAREQEERKATWLELFYDLIFVALVAQLTHALAENPVTSIKFSVLYLIIWRTWHGTTMYRYKKQPCGFTHSAPSVQTKVFFFGLAHDMTLLI